jgi:dephospho-CoA kinase
MGKEMLWIGLTGGIGSGKTTASTYIQKLGFPVLNADLVAHEVMTQGHPAYDSILNLFGTKVLGKNGEVDRKALGRIVFAEPDKLSLLEAIVHPEVEKYVANWKNQRQKQGDRVAVYDVPLLFEKGMQSKFDKTIVVFCPLEIQKQRVRLRDGLTEEEIDQRLSRQMPLQKKAALADIVIDNSGSLKKLEQQIQNLSVFSHQAQE